MEKSSIKGGGEIYLKKLDLEEPIEIFNLFEKAANGDWESIESQKIIEDNKGILENTVDQTKRYWITINKEV